MQREIIKWLQSLDLTYPVRHPQQDLSNGFTLAEIVSRYDRSLSMHSYVPGCSSECKRRNWKVLLRDLKRIGCTSVTAEMAEATAQGKPGVASAVLENICEFFSGWRPPPPLNSNASNTTALLNVLDLCWFEKNGLDAEPFMKRPLPLRVMENDDVTLRKGITQPGFARPTAVALLHIANRDTRNAPLIAAVPPDEFRALKRNERLLNDHEMIQKACRYVEPQRFAPVNHHSLYQSKKSRNGVIRGKMFSGCDSRATLDNVSHVNVNVMNNQLLCALNQGESLNDVAEKTDDLIKMQSQKLLEACDNNLYVALPKLLGMVLQSEEMHEIYWDLCSEKYGGDVFCMFISRREQIPSAAVLACWKMLLRSSDAIALALLAHPDEYMYLLRALNFIFAADVSLHRSLHVSYAPQEDRGELMTASNSDVSAREGTPTVNFSTPGDNDIDDNRGRHRSGDSESVGSALLSHLECPDGPKQTVFSNSKAFSVASAFAFFSKIGRALHAASPSSAVSLLMQRFIPAASKLFLSANPAILEAIACVVVAHVCGAGNTSPITQSTPSQSEANQQEKELKEISWKSSTTLASLLMGPLKALFFEAEETDSVGLLKRHSQYNLFLYHVVCQSRSVLGVDGEGMQGERGGKDCGDTLAGVGHDSEHYRFLKVGTTNCEKSSLNLVDLCALRVPLCLGSSSLQERSVGLALLLQLIMRDRWDLAICSFLSVVHDIRENGASSGFLQRAAATWENRILLLELLTIAFRKALHLIADDPGYLKKNNSEFGSSSCSWRTSTSLDPLKKIDFSALEEATVSCFLSFSNAPLLQRQLALQIVGKRFLPDEQRNVAAVWLRALFMFPVDQLEFLLRPHETGQLQMPEPTASTQFRARAKISTAQKDVTVMSDHRDVKTEERLLPREKGSPEKTGGAFSNDETSSSVRMLLGRVEPAYVVTPLNQSWDTFSVVQAVIMYEDLLTTAQMFSVILAAVLSPQRRELDELKLLQNLRDLSVARAEMITTCNSRRSDKTLQVETNKTSVDGDKRSLDVSLKTLTGSYKRMDVGKQELRKVSKESRDLAVFPFPNENISASDDAVTADVDDGVRGQQQQHEEAGDRDKWGESNGEEDQVAESHVTAFWFSVLRLLRPQLQRCLVSGNPGGEHQLHSSAEPREGPMHLVFGISRTEDLKQSRVLARKVLLALYSRFGAPLSGPETLSEECICDALEWLNAI